MISPMSNYRNQYNSTTSCHQTFFISIPLPTNLQKTSRHCNTVCSTSTSTSTSHATNIHPLFYDDATVKHFLRYNWGKKPVLFRQLFKSFQSPISPDELAGIACEPDANARIVQGGHRGPNDEHYTLQIGPFTDETFQKLPSTHWTLLVRHADHYIPSISDLLSKFSFIPRWRVDDVMVSYAPAGGSVGPHVDNYDVFLIQASGRRRWTTTNTPILAEDERLVPDIDVRVLQGAFKPDYDWILEPGDALYIPPRFPHHGVSMDDECMTFSVGFRAPTIANLITGWAEHLVEQHRLNNVFLDDDIDDLIDNINDPGRISKIASERAFAKITECFSSNKQTSLQFSKWFAMEVSRNSLAAFEDLEPLSEQDATKSVQLLLSRDDLDVARTWIRQNESVTFSYQFDDTSNIFIYVNGESWRVENMTVANFFCNTRCIDARLLIDFIAAEPSARLTLIQFLQAGLLYISEE